MKRLEIAMGLACVLLGGIGARADVWDATNDNDNSTTTNNALIHGTDQVHDLADLAGGGGDRDWYFVPVAPFSSYEVLVDGQTGDLDFDAESVRRFVFPSTFAQDSSEVGAFAFSLRWANPSAAGASNTVQIRALACDITPCTTADQYRIRSFDTTYSIPRFNNSGTQTTLFLIQNLSEASCAVNVHYFGASGVLIGSASTPVAGRGVATVATATTAPGQSGSARVTHDCGYGGLSGKAVALEPSTGFTFDTAMVARPH
jgi:hypothetical protein